MSFYLKYRSRTVDELDITEVRESLAKIIKSGNIPHAFLFSGPKGTGKTSAARIIAKVVNCQNPGKEGEPCNKCEQCLSIAKGSNLDVIEIDAASHRGIDDVRALRDAVKLSPAKALKKIYIIDEAHMLTVEASNALLKTLEEPPEHVIFILATTNPEKLIPTIRSRTTALTFRKANSEEIVRSLKRVAKGEEIKISDDVLKTISSFADGSFRDGVKLFEQLVTEVKSMDPVPVNKFLSQNRVADPDHIIALLLAKEEQKVITLLEEEAIKGVAMDEMLRQILAKLHGYLLAKAGLGEDQIANIKKNDLVDLIELMNIAFGQLNSTPIDQLPIEVAVVKWCRLGNLSEGEDSRQNEINKKTAPKPEREVKDTERVENSESEVSAEDKKRPILVQSKVNSGSDLAEELGDLENVSEDIWKQILLKIKPINTSIEALLRAAKPLGYNHKMLKLGVFYRFHKERLEDNHHRKVLEEVVQAVTGNSLRIVCTLTQPPQKAVKEEKKEETVLTEGGDKDIIRVAEEIFNK